jgi:hypothetical protein
VSVGKALYRDIAYFNGPLSTYFNAAMFYLFGIRQHVLWYANMTILAGIIVMLYVILRQLGGRLAGACGALVFIGLFAFSQFTLIANYNYVAPYSQEMTHGAALSLAGLCWLIRYQRTRAIPDVMLGGLTTACCFSPGQRSFSAGSWR